MAIEVHHKTVMREIRIKKGQRVTFGPLAIGGRFPACWRVYEGKELICALSGVVWFHRRDLEVKTYKAVEN